MLHEAVIFSKGALSDDFAILLAEAPKKGRFCILCRKHGSSPSRAGWQRAVRALAKIKAVEKTTEIPRKAGEKSGNARKNAGKPKFYRVGAPAGIRIPDTLIKSQVLYRLSYRGVLNRAILY